MEALTSVTALAGGDLATFVNRLEAPAVESDASTEVLVLGAARTSVAVTAVVDATIAIVGLTAGAPISVIAVWEGCLMSFFRDGELDAAAGVAPEALAHDVPCALGSVLLVGAAVATLVGSVNNSLEPGLAALVATTSFGRMLTVAAVAPETLALLVSIVAAAGAKLVRAIERSLETLAVGVPASVAVASSASQAAARARACK